MENTTELNWIPFNDSSCFSFSYPLALSALSTISQLKAANLHPALPTIGTVSQKKAATMLRSVPIVSTVSQKKAAVLHPAVVAILTVAQKKAAILKASVAATAVITQLKAITLRTHDTLVYWFEFDYAPFNTWTGASSLSSLSAHNSVNQAKSINLHPRLSAISTILSIKAIVRKASIAIPLVIDHIWTIWPERALAILSTITLKKIINLHLINSPHDWSEFNEDAFNIFNIAAGASLSVLSTISQAKAVDLHQAATITTTSSQKKGITLRPLVTAPLVVSGIKAINWHFLRTIATTVLTYILVRWPGLKAKARIETLKGKVRK